MVYDSPTFPRGEYLLVLLLEASKGFKTEPEISNGGNNEVCGFTICPISK